MRATGVPSTAAIPASPMIAVIGSVRASIASGEVSRNDTNTARGATSTAGARSHQLRSTAGAGVASLLTPERVASRAVL